MDEPGEADGEAATEEGQSAPPVTPAPGAGALAAGASAEVEDIGPSAAFCEVGPPASSLGGSAPGAAPEASSVPVGALRGASAVRVAQLAPLSLPGRLVGDARPPAGDTAAHVSALAACGNGVAAAPDASQGKLPSVQLDSVAPHLRACGWPGSAGSVSTPTLPRQPTATTSASLLLSSAASPEPGLEAGRVFTAAQPPIFPCHSAGPGAAAFAASGLTAGSPAVVNGSGFYVISPPPRTALAGACGAAAAPCAASAEADLKRALLLAERSGAGASGAMVGDVPALGWLEAMHALLARQVQRMEAQLTQQTEDRAELEAAQAHLQRVQRTTELHRLQLADSIERKEELEARMRLLLTQADSLSEESERKHKICEGMAQHLNELRQTLAYEPAAPVFRHLANMHPATMPQPRPAPAWLPPPAGLLGRLEALASEAEKAMAVAAKGQHGRAWSGYAPPPVVTTALSEVGADAAAHLHTLRGVGRYGRSGGGGGAARSSKSGAAEGGESLSTAEELAYHKAESYDKGSSESGQSSDGEASGGSSAGHSWASAGVSSAGECSCGSGESGVPTSSEAGMGDAHGEQGGEGGGEGGGGMDEVSNAGSSHSSHGSRGAGSHSGSSQSGCSSKSSNRSSSESGSSARNSSAGGSSTGGESAGGASLGASSLSSCASSVGSSCATVELSSEPAKPDAPAAHRKRHRHKHAAPAEAKQRKLEQHRPGAKACAAAPANGRLCIAAPAEPQPPPARHAVAGRVRSPETSEALASLSALHGAAYADSKANAEHARTESARAPPVVRSPPPRTLPAVPDVVVQGVIYDGPVRFSADQPLRAADRPSPQPPRLDASPLSKCMAPAACGSPVPAPPPFDRRPRPASALASIPQAPQSWRFSDACVPPAAALRPANVAQGMLPLHQQALLGCQGVLSFPSAPYAAPSPAPFQEYLGPAAFSPAASFQGLQPGFTPPGFSPAPPGHALGPYCWAHGHGFPAPGLCGGGFPVQGVVSCHAHGGAAYGAHCSALAPAPAPGKL